MAKKRRARAASARKGRRFSIPVIASIAVLAVAAITVVSRQVVTGETTPAAKTAAAKKYVTVKVAGQDVQVDSQTGQVKPLSPQEQRQLADGLRGLVNNSSEGLVGVKQPDGSTALDLQGRFQNVAVARVNEDGSVTESCVNDPRAAANFFSIDPKLMGVSDTPPQTNQPAKSATVKSTLQ